MKLELKRIALRETYTIGRLFINGERFCDTLEDKVRDMPKEPKVMHETAIPKGTYTIIMNDSVKFKRRMPLLLDVPYFKGIRIHSGNKATHSSGCILVGINSVKGGLTESKRYEGLLYDILNKAQKNKEKITIEII